MSRRIRADDLDPRTRQTLVALAAPEPLVGPPDHRLFRDVLGGQADLLTDEVVAHERDFVSNEPHGHAQRHGWALADPPPAADRVLDFVRRQLPRLTAELRLTSSGETGTASRPELELSDVIVTVHRDGDFLGPHHDDGWPGLRNGRLLSFVYWFHNRPRRFEGGALTLTGWTSRDGVLSPTGPKVDLEPVHDSMVVFPSCTRHELHAVRCVPDEFRSARFALVGFIRRATEIRVPTGT